ncbi:hypothetical protein QVD17_13537 [Tagetes erecta]|uniref:Uncharacterized protein n=1 Tax=Tagetes erecta TaxID=13708 RepID=A0AAD8L3I8_TARER|nr:hypothetical protein QVD17_13537 [Tagetes erecta]
MPTSSILAGKSSHPEHLNELSRAPLSHILPERDAPRAPYLINKLVSPPRYPLLAGAPMAAKPLTNAAIEMTEKKMDMSLDDIIKMSKNGTGLNKPKKQRIFNKNQKFSNNVVQDKSMKLRHFMDNRSTLRQGAFGQRRTNFQGNQFSYAAEAARKAAVAPVRNSNFNRNQAVTSYRPRAVGRPAQNRASIGGGVAVMKKQRNVAPKQKAQTLDSLFANMKEQRMKVLSQHQHQHQNQNQNQSQHQHNNNAGRRNGAGQQRPRPPWTRYNN